MTTREAIIDLWELAGEPSDLDPWAVGSVNFDPLVDLDQTSAGAIYYMRQLSMAQVALSNWRTRRGRPIRFKKFMTQTNVKIGRNGADLLYEITFIDKFTLRLTDLYTAVQSGLTEDKLNDSSLFLNGTYDDGSGNKTVTQTTMVARAVYDPINDYYTLSLRDEVNNEAYTDGSGTVHAYDSFQAEIYFDRFPLERTGTPSMNGSAIEMPFKFRNILKITNMKDGTDLMRVESKENLFNPYQNTGTPVNWYTLGEVIYFDQFLNETLWHTIEYQRLPFDITTLDQAFDIPEEWHEVILLIVEWRNMKRMQDKQRANELYTEIVRWIDTLRTDQEEDWLREHTKGFYIRKEAR